MCESDELTRLGSKVLLDIENVDFSDCEETSSVAEMIAIIQLGTCGQFHGKGAIAQVNFPYVTLR